MDLGREGKVALITGSSQSVGREIAKVLASEGAKVVVNDIIMERADSVAKEINDAGGTAMSIRAVVTDLEQVQAMVS
jgi:3-oxoacyl-[acyl-carrier protein] reductase